MRIFAVTTYPPLSYLCVWFLLYSDLYTLFTHYLIALLNARNAIATFM